MKLGSDLELCGLAWRLSLKTLRAVLEPQAPLLRKAMLLWTQGLWSACGLQECSYVR